MQSLKSIDLNLAAQKQWGDGFYAFSLGNHIYQWRAKLGARYESMDLQKAVQSQYGPDFKLVLSGVDRDGWKAFNHLAFNYQVLPVLQIATDYFYDPTSVKIAVDNLNSLVASIREFYRLQVGKTFSLLETICQRTSLNSQQWYDLAQKSIDPVYREEYGDKSMEILKAEFGYSINPKIIYLVTQFCGPNPSNKISPYGAINRGNISVIPATACLEQRTTNDPNDFSSLFACGHELGHGFGLPHTDSVPESEQPYGWQNSIMQWGWNDLPTANLTEKEKAFLYNSPYFK